MPIISIFIAIILLYKFSRIAKKILKKDRIYNPSLVKAVALLIPEDLNDFEEYYEYYLTDRKAFVLQYHDVLDRYKEFAMDKLNELQALYIFANERNKCLVAEYLGESTEGEINRFIESIIDQPMNWTYSNKLRMSVPLNLQNESEFVIKLLKAIDADLEIVGYKMLLYDMSWESYILSVVDIHVYRKIRTLTPDYFYGSERLSIY